MHTYAAMGRFTDFEPIHPVASRHRLRLDLRQTGENAQQAKCEAPLPENLSQSAHTPRNTAQ